MNFIQNLFAFESLYRVVDNLFVHQNKEVVNEYEEQKGEEHFVPPPSATENIICAPPEPMSASEPIAMPNIDDIDEHPFVYVPSKALPKQPKDLCKKPLRPLRRVIVFDTETTGLLPKHVYGQPFPPDHLYPHIIQICFVVYDFATGKIIDQMNEYVRIADNIPITPEITKITGISRQTVKQKGKPLAPLLLRFYDALIKCDAAVAHNISFDKTVIRKEMYRCKSALRQLTSSPAKVDDMIRSLTEKFFDDRGMQSICTMMSTIQLCDLWYVPFGALPTLDAQGYAVDASQKRKMPKLSELYECLFERAAPAGLHDAMVDVRVCLDCFIEIKRREQQAAAMAEVKKTVAELVDAAINVAIGNIL